MFVILSMITLLLCETKTFKNCQKNLKKNFELDICQFEDNYIKLNTGKCNLLTSCHKYEHQWTQIGKHMVQEENKVKRLEITTENELVLDSHILNICSKADKKLSILCRLKNISATKDNLKLFFEVQFKYYPLI